jgi:hypothetical protein
MGTEGIVSFDPFLALTPFIQGWEKLTHSAPKRRMCQTMPSRAADDLGHAQFPLLELVQNARARSISHRPEYLGGTFERR